MTQFTQRPLMAGLDTVTAVISGSIAIGVIPPVQLASGTTVLVQPMDGTQFHTVVDGGVVTLDPNSSVYQIINPVTVVQPAGASLHAVVDSGNVTVANPVLTVQGAVSLPFTMTSPLPVQLSDGKLFDDDTPLLRMLCSLSTKQLLLLQTLVEALTGQRVPMEIPSFITEGG